MLKPGAEKYRVNRAADPLDTGAIVQLCDESLKKVGSSGICPAYLTRQTSNSEKRSSSSRRSRRRNRVRKPHGSSAGTLRDPPGQDCSPL